MHLTAHLDLDVVGLEQDDELTLMIDLAAPATSTSTRRPATLQVVIDRSGSMRDGRLDAARDALCTLIERLAPTDNLGVIAFDHEIDVVVPAGPLTDKAAAKAAISDLTPRGRTDLSGGYLRGLQEARRVAGDTGATLLLLSDGRANAGVVDLHRLGAVAARAQAQRISTTALGLGLGYDEQPLDVLARNGGGSVHFAEEADTAAAQLCGEVDGLLQQVAQAASLQIRMSPNVKALAVLNDVPVQQVANGVTIELGSLLSGETRRLLLRLQVPGLAALGLAQVAELILTFVSLPDLVQHTVTAGVHVNVVPGDQAAGRIPNPVVQSEALFQQTQASKRRATELLRHRDVAGACGVLRETASTLRSAAAALPPELTGDLLSEAQIASDLADGAAAGAVARTVRSSSADAARKSRMRGRTSNLALVRADGGDTLLIEHWQLEQLRRHAEHCGPRLSTTRPNDERVARQLADELGPAHVLYGFFDAAARAGGFRVEPNR